MITTRWSGVYSQEQDTKQQYLNDIAYAAGYGFAACRLPTPGVVLPADVVEERLGQVAAGWANEARIRDKVADVPTTRGFDPRVELGKHAQEYLAERLLPYPQTERPWQSPTAVRPVQHYDEWGDG